jgi:hypothetical protein
LRNDRIKSGVVHNRHIGRPGSGDQKQKYRTQDERLEQPVATQGRGDPEMSEPWSGFRQKQKITIGKGTYHWSSLFYIHASQFYNNQKLL